jgi:GNAT superfamily N-acetyltransferase
MSQQSVTVRPHHSPVYRTDADPATLLQFLPAIRALADGDKEALGFLPDSAYREAIEKRRLIVMRAVNRHPQMAGFILFGGVFPHAKIQQIMVAKEHHREGLASALVNAVVSQLEARGYLTNRRQSLPTCPKHKPSTRTTDLWCVAPFRAD